LAAETLDNAMEEAVAGRASFMDVALEQGTWLTVRDNGQRPPTPPHRECAARDGASAYDVGAVTRRAPRRPASLGRSLCAWRSGAKARDALNACSASRIV